MTWVLANLDRIATLAAAHLWLTVAAIVLSVAVAVPLGWVAHRYRWSRLLTLTAAGLLYAVPSLPLFIVLPLVLGTGVRDAANVVVAMSIYGVALLVRAVADALESVGEAPLLAATAVGYSPWRRFWAVELPLAGPVLLAGIRVVAVSTTSLVTVSALLGVPNLGLLFTDGFQRGIIAEVLAGILATVLLAALVDLLLVAAGRVLLPWTVAEAGRAA